MRLRLSEQHCAVSAGFFIFRHQRRRLLLPSREPSTPRISWLGERLTSYHLIGGGMTLLGVLLAQLLVKPVMVRRRARLAMATCRED